MDLTNYLEMDPFLLVGLINTELRNQAESLEDLAKTHNLSASKLTERLRSAGFEYQAAQMQFR